MMMKKLAIAGFVSMALSGGAFAQDAAPTCDGDCAITANNLAQNVQYIASETGFVVSSFAFSVSANVGLNSSEDPAAIAVGTASSKGRTPYTGSSNGGAVTSCGPVSTGSDPADVPDPILANVAGCEFNDPLVALPAPPA